MDDPKRNLSRTGRTTRMLEYAISRANEDKHVIVYCLTCDQEKRLFDQLLRMTGLGFGTPLLVKRPDLSVGVVIRRGSVTVKRIVEAFDWSTFRERGLSEDTETLMDHHDIECYLPEITEMLYRFISQHPRYSGGANDRKINPDVPMFILDDLEEFREAALGLGWLAKTAVEAEKFLESIEDEDQNE